MEEAYILSTDDIISIMNDINDKKVVNKAKKMSMCKKTYDFLMVDNMVALALLADEVEIDESVEEGSVKVVNNLEESPYENLSVRKVHHRSKYTKKKHVYKKKNTGGYKKGK